MEYRFRKNIFRKQILQTKVRVYHFSSDYVDTHIDFSTDYECSYMEWTDAGQDTANELLIKLYCKSEDEK